MPLDCAHCGARNPDPANFCRNCGRALGDPNVRSATRLTPLMQTWRQLNHQMTRKEARRVLGEPLFIDLEDARDAAACETWVYEYTAAGEAAVGAPGRERRTRGSLRFQISEGRLVGWTEPDWELLAPAAPRPVPPPP